MTVAWGLIGAGVISEHFAGDIQRSNGMTLKGVWSRSANSADGLVSRHGGKRYATLPDMLADPVIDAVYIATPNDSHAAFAEAAILAGKAVLVEKPFALSVTDAERISALAAERRVFLMEAMWTRFLPAMAFVRETVRSGELGPVQRVEADLGFFKPFIADSRFFDPARGGGSLLDLGVYGISLCLDLFGRPDAVDSVWRSAPSGVDMSARLDLRYGAMTATLTSTFEQQSANLFVIEGARETIILQPPFIGARSVIRGTRGPALALAQTSGNSILARIARKAARALPLPGLTRHGFDYSGHGLQFEIKAVGDALSRGRIDHELSPMIDTIDTLRIIDKCLAKPPVGQAR